MEPLKFRLWDPANNRYVGLSQLIPVDKNLHFILGGEHEMYTGYHTEDDVEIYEKDVLATDYGYGTVENDGTYGFYIEMENGEDVTLEELAIQGNICGGTAIVGDAHSFIPVSVPAENSFPYRGNNYPITVVNGARIILFEGNEILIDGLTHQDIIDELDDCSMFNER